MSLISGFDATTVEPSQELQVLPAGEYELAITKIEEKSNSAGTGRYAAFTFTVTSGEFENRKVFTNLNLDNPNAVAVTMAKEELSSICHAIDVLKPQSYDDLLNRCLIAKVLKEKRKDNGDWQNTIKRGSYRAADSGPAAGPSTDQPKETSGTNNKPAKAPWKR